ncbi:MAG: sulfotransferase [Aestuariivirga sp.]|uniref:tetratricopeptide repeat-containing sulfotransferase family protein n=1 Tax=Aestuariivirga sp. TaxID=2650926 RepID=UPI0038CF7A9E
MMAGRGEQLTLALSNIEELAARGQLARAEALARQLVAANPLVAAAHFTLGIVLQSAGRFELAEPALARAVTLNGRNIDYVLNYGLCLLLMGRVAEAAPLYERALALEPRGFQAIWRYGSFEARLGHMEEALRRYESALARAPEAARHAIRLDILEALLSLGRVEEALRRIAHEFAATPYKARYLCLKASAGRHEAGSELDRDIARLLESPGLAPEERSDLMIRQGVMLQASGRHDDAFATMLAAKKLLKAPAVTPAFTAEVEARMAAFTPERVQRLIARHGRSRFRPIFVVGLPRSGTTLAAQILSSHSKAGNAGELETMTYAAAKLADGRPLAEIEAALERMGDAKIDAIASLYEQAMGFVVPGRERPVDKMPLNFRFVAEASILFPGARFVHCTRHPADTFMSAFQTEMNPAHSYSYDPADYAAYHRQYRRLMAHWHSALPGRVFHLSYETLVTEPEPAIRALLDFAGLGFEAACLEPERNPAAVTTFSRLQVRSGINAASVGRWRPYEKHLRPILESMAA